MNYLDTTSLFNTIDNVSEALLFNREIGIKEKSEIIDFIIQRQGLPHAYANTFAPTDRDLKGDLILFTGERISTNAGKCHTIGEETCRVLRKLNAGSYKVKLTLQKADNGLRYRIDEYFEEGRYEYGMYCCKRCSLALWLNLASGGLGKDTRLLEAGLRSLKKFRDKKGRWNGFPYYYTLYVLNEIEPEMAREEIKYTSPVLERKLKMNHAEENKYAVRRKYIGEQLLNKVKNY